MISKLVFSVTYDCPISCKYCVTRSGPHSGPYLDAEFMKEVISDLLDQVRLYSVIFTGGEPLLKLSEVEATIRFASSRGLWTRIVTNAFWAKKPAIAERLLRRLREAGLCEINFSCDDLHQEHIPLRNIYNAFWASKRIGLPILIAHKRIVNARITPEYLSEFLGIQLKEFEQGKECQDGLDLYSSSLTVPVGHGVENLDEAEYILYPEGPSAWTAPCSGVMDGLVISPKKELRICCGMIEQSVPELGYGIWDSNHSAKMISEANSDLIANWLALEGPFGLMRFIQEKAPAVAFKDRYVNHCHLCNDILTRSDTRAVLAQYAEEKCVELSLRRGMLEALRYADEDPPGRVGNDSFLPTVTA
jgi:hypothetical protein